MRYNLSESLYALVYVYTTEWSKYCIGVFILKLIFVCAATTEFGLQP